MVRPKILIAACILALAGGGAVAWLRDDTAFERATNSSQPAAPSSAPAIRSDVDELPLPGSRSPRLAARADGAHAKAQETWAPLAYAQAWDGTMPPAMAAFRDWTQDYLWAETPFDQAILEFEGMALARARRVEMLALIRSNPELALALTVPAALRSLLPPAVDGLLEERIAGRGDYEIVMAVQPLGSRMPEEEIRRVVLGGRELAAHVYGRRARQLSQEGASLHGIALDGEMAVHESPLRVLEPGEVLAEGLAAGQCPVSAAPLARIAAQAPVNVQAQTVVEVDGRPWQLADESLIDSLEAALIAAEDQVGPAVPQVMAGETVLALAPTSWTTGVKSLLIIRVDFSDKPGEPVPYATALDVMESQVRPYYDTISYGATSLTATVSTAVYRMPQTAEAYATGNLSSQLYTDATAAAAADYTIANYQHVMILFTRLNGISGSKFTWAGLGSVGGGKTWVNGYYDFRVTAHELGHNYGLYHANLWQVTDGNPASTGGTTVGYGDPFDIMGGGNTDARHHMNPWFKNRMGWLPDAAVLPVTSSGTYRLTRYDAKSTPLDRNLALNVFCDGQRTYWVGFRQNFTSTTSLYSGAYVVWGFGTNQESQLLDMTTPGSNAGDAGLAIGSAFTDAAHGITVRPIAKGGSAPAEYLDVEVTVGQPASPFAAAWGSSSAASSLPAEVTAVRDVAAGSQHGIALRSDGTVTAWGSNGAGQSTVPAGLEGVVAIAARGNVNGAVTHAGSVVVWGDGANGVTTTPSGLSGAVALAIGTDHALALRSDGTVVAWGNNSHGEATVPADLTSVVAIAAGSDTSYAVRSNGTVTRWGASHGTIPAGLSGVVAIAAASRHAVALRSDGTVVAWGDNTYGQIAVPSGLANITSVRTSSYHTLALRSDGTVAQWGSVGGAGAQPPALSRVSALAAGEYSSLVVIGSNVLSTPSFTAQPQSRAVAAGQSAQFSVSASGSLALTYQWQRSSAGGGGWTDITNNGTYSGATTSNLTVGPVTLAMNGDQFRCVVSYAGASPATSDAASLTVASAPQIGTQPASGSGTAGGALTLTVGATGTGTLTYQWRLNGADIAGATGSTYTIPSLQSFHAGTYTVVVTSGGVSTTSAGAIVGVTPAATSSARPLNLSTRALCRTGTDPLIPGFVIEGTGTKRLLIRAVGPTLGALGVSGTLADPQIVLTRYNPATQAYETQVTNDNWGTNANAALIQTTASNVGAFTLGAGSADAALLVDLAPGRYTVVADGKANSSGLAMVELYDADAGTPTARMVNISNRGYVGVGDNIMIPGFVVSSEGSRTFLIRAVGPGLQSTFGLPGVLADPQIAIFKRRTDSPSDELILTNDNWDGVAGAATTSAVASEVGAFPLVAGSRDAAFVVTLPPGVYTVLASGVGGTFGVALVEVYLRP